MDSDNVVVPTDDARHETLTLKIGDVVDVVCDGDVLFVMKVHRFGPDSVVVVGKTTEAGTMRENYAEGYFNIVPKWRSGV